jgi:hypothetical protein
MLCIVKFGYGMKESTELNGDMPASCTLLSGSVAEPVVWDWFASLRRLTMTQNVKTAVTQ